MIYARCRRILGDDASAEDATQETFVRVQRHLAKAPDSREALRWIYRIATNYCLGELRSRKVRARPVERGSESDDRPGDEFANRDLVVRVLSRVPTQTGRVAWLYHVDGMDQQEVSDVLGVSRRTVVNRLAEFAKQAGTYVRRTQ
jgi:RNA polymerase sigma-70 factor (ECF subfamily)